MKVPLVYRAAEGPSYLIGDAELQEDGVVECVVNMRVVEGLRLADEDNPNLRFRFVIPEEHRGNR